MSNCLSSDKAHEYLPLFCIFLLILTLLTKTRKKTFVFKRENEKSKFTSYEVTTKIRENSNFEKKLVV
jgi:hypothetical protein